MEPLNHCSKSVCVGGISENESVLAVLDDFRCPVGRRNDYGKSARHSFFRGKCKRVFQRSACEDIGGRIVQLNIAARRQKMHAAIKAVLADQPLIRCWVFPSYRQYMDAGLLQLGYCIEENGKAFIQPVVTNQQYRENGWFQLERITCSSAQSQAPVLIEYLVIDPQIKNRERAWPPVMALKFCGGFFA